MCSYSELFWSVFSHIWTEYGEIRPITLYSVGMPKNTDHKTPNTDTFYAININQRFTWLPILSNNIKYFKNDCNNFLIIYFLILKRCLQFGEYFLYGVLY